MCSQPQGRESPLAILVARMLLGTSGLGAVLGIVLSWSTRHTRLHLADDEATYEDDEVLASSISAWLCRAVALVEGLRRHG